jgi:adenine-specific DNA-methyltransferase
LSKSIAIQTWMSKKEEAPLAGTEVGRGYPVDISNLAFLGEADELFTNQAQLLEGTIRLALIDPPYNTSSQFHHYSDKQSSHLWMEDRRRHAKHIQALLTPDGSLWMHLDDREMHYAKVMLDEVFGRKNYVGTIVWQKSVSRENRTDLSTIHEYILVYAKNKQVWARRRNKLAATDEQLARYKNPDNDPRGPWTSGDMTAKAGPGRRAAQFYDLKLPSGRVVKPAQGMSWRFTRDRLESLIQDGRVSFGSRGDSVPRLKRFLTETQGGLVPTTWWPAEEVGTTDTAKKELRRLFPEMVPFETPKPERLVKRIIEISTDADDIVLDCYGGSGTTAAVAHKLGRRWITGEREARTFHEVLIPRLEAVVAGEDGGVSKEAGWSGGGNFEIRGGVSRAQAV